MLQYLFSIPIDLDDVDIIWGRNSFIGIGVPSERARHPISKRWTLHPKYYHL